MTKRQNALLKYLVQKRIKKSQLPESISYEIGKIKFFNFKGIEIENCTISKDDKLFIIIKRIRITISIFNLFFKKRDVITSLKIDSIVLNFKSKSDKIFNNHFGLNKGQHKWKETSLIRIYGKIVDFTFQKNININIYRIDIYWHNRKVSFIDFILNRKEIFLKVEYNSMLLVMQSSINRTKKELSFPCLYFEHKSNVFSFDKMALQIKCGKEKDIHKLFIDIDAESLIINNKLICANTLKVNNIINNINIEFNDFFLNIDEFDVNIDNFAISFNSFYAYGSDNLMKFILGFRIEDDNLDFLRNAFYSKLKNLVFSGGITFVTTFVFVIENPFEQFFEIKTENNTLKIVDWGNLNLFNLNNDFEHLAVKNGIRLKKLFVSKSNPHFIRYNQISKELRNIIIFFEDPNFYDHSGVEPYFIGQALAVNLANHNFRKGASTITMQLIRNLFINEQKNMIRKIEETILALLLENFQNIPKSRILEIYLNIIEFGPNIYGIYEASIYYFNKEPIALSITEIIILTYIIPRPMHFNEALLIKSEQLETNLKKYFGRASSLLLKANIISQEKYDNLESVIYFSNDFGKIVLK